MANMTQTLYERLAAVEACVEAREWAQPYATLAEAWAACERADWMGWWLERMYPATPQVRLMACACARTALRYVPAGEDRPRIAIETAERYARGEATARELQTAWATANNASDAAWDASASARARAAMSASAAAANAAANAMSAAANAAAACSTSRSARAAADAAAWAAASADTNNGLAVMIRDAWPDPETVPAMFDPTALAAKHFPEATNG